MVLVIGQLKLGNIWRSDSEILNLIFSHLHRYPLMGVKDVYKLLYQGALGSKHELLGGEGAERKLVVEFERTPADEGKPLWENLRPDGEIVRLNFAPYKARGGDANSVTTMSLWTASSFKGSPQDLQDSWQTFKRLCSDGRLGKFGLGVLEEFDEWLERHNYPPVHHSDAYLEAYHPAYRLIHREFLNLITSGK